MTLAAYKNIERNPLQLLTTGSNIAIKKLSCFTELFSTSLTNNIGAKLSDTGYLFDTIA